MSASAEDLERFVEAQEPVFDAVRAELQAGKKRTHWMWFIFPQLRGLGRTSTAQLYGIESADEARRYWAHPVLWPRLKDCVGWALAAPQGMSAHDIFGSPDDLKFRSCLTLFQRVAPDEPLFAAALERFYEGQADARTVDLLVDDFRPTSE
jgi:uncharacterized protein (DUF1810 family)